MAVSQRSLDLQAKRFNQVRLYERAVANLHRHGIAIQAGTMFGLDGDDSGIFERTLRFYRGIGIDSATVGIVVPMPGTPFFDEMVRTGRLLTTDWEAIARRLRLRECGRANCRSFEIWIDRILANAAIKVQTKRRHACPLYGPSPERKAFAGMRLKPIAAI